VTIQELLTLAFRAERLKSVLKNLPCLLSMSERG